MNMMINLDKIFIIDYFYNYNFAFFLETSFNIHTSIYESSFWLAITPIDAEIELKEINKDLVIDYNGENLPLPVSTLRACLLEVAKENGVYDVTILLCGSDKTPVFQLHFLSPGQVGVLMQSLSNKTFQHHLCNVISTQTEWQPLNLSTELYLVTPNIEKHELLFREVLQSNWEECVQIFTEGMICNFLESFQKKGIKAIHLTSKCRIMNLLKLLYFN